MPKTNTVFFPEECTCSAKVGRYPICVVCLESEEKLRKHVTNLFQPSVKRPGRCLPIECILVNNPAKARLEIEGLQKENSKLRKQRAKNIFNQEINQHTSMVSTLIRIICAKLDWQLRLWMELLQS